MLHRVAALALAVVLFPYAALADASVKTYTADDKSFTVELPATWHTYKFDQPGVLLRTRNVTDNGGTKRVSTFLVATNPSGGRALAVEAENARKGAAEVGRDVSEMADLKIGGQPAKRYSYKKGEGKEETTRWQAVLIQGGNTYVMMYMCDTPVSEAGLKEFDRILATWKWVANDK